MDGTHALSDEALLEVAGFDVAWVEAGTEVRRPLRDAVGIAFEDVQPVRDFPSYRGQRHFPGLYWSATTGRHVGFESWLEWDHAMLLDFDPYVTRASRPAGRSRPTPGRHDPGPATRAHYRLASPAGG